MGERKWTLKNFKIHLIIIKMKLYIYLFLVFNLFACQSNKDDCKKSEQFLNEFSKGFSGNLPPPNSNLLMFFKLDDGSLIKVNNIELKSFYKKDYSEKINFNEFLCLLFNGKLLLKKAQFDRINKNYQIVKPNKVIEALDIKSITDKYCTKIDNHLLLKNNTDVNTRLTILYLFFKNKNYISFDNYSGFYMIRVGNVPN